MTQEEKQLLLKDLCARLPYHVVAKSNIVIDGHELEGEITNCTPYGEGFVSIGFTVIPIKNIKPYLRPLSSMTEEEKFNYVANIKEEPCVEELPIQPRIPSVDYLNSHHFDYRNLIEKGLALEAPSDCIT